LIIGAESLALPIAATEHLLDRRLDELRAQLLQLQPAANHTTISSLCGDLLNGEIETPAAHDPSLRAATAAVLLSGDEGLPAFEVAFLLGFGSNRELFAAIGGRDGGVT
jgi:hypothetical protein